MKPRFDSERPYGDRNQRLPRANRPSAKDLVNDTELSRAEVTLYLIMAGSVLTALVQHAHSAHRFIQEMPEFAIALANLVRNVV